MNHSPLGANTRSLCAMAVVSGNDEKRSGFCVILFFGQNQKPKRSMPSARTSKTRGDFCLRTPEEGNPKISVQASRNPVLIGRGIVIFRGQKDTLAISFIVSRYRDNLTSPDSYTNLTKSATPEDLVTCPFQPNIWGCHGIHNHV